MPAWRTLRSHWRNANANVKLALLWTAAETASSSIRSGDIVSAYIYLLSGNNATVGWIQGVNGLMQMLFSFPAGWMADRLRRDNVLRGAAFVGLLALLTLAYVFLSHAPIWTLWVGMALLGGYRGFNNPPLESIFSDSVQTGHSSALYTAKWVVQNVASCLGPLLSIVLFASLGNTWQIGTCRIVLIVGLTLMVAPLVLMLFFDDDKTLGLPSEAITVTASYESLPNSADQQPPQPQSDLFWRQWAIPVLISGSDMIGALASGMTIKFFSLYFIEMVHLSPVYVSSISLVAPLGISMLSLLLQSLSCWLGSVTLSVATRAFDIGLLVGMAFTPTDSSAAFAHLLVATHLVRTAMANASRPLLRSILMDHVPKRLRARFNALESVRSFSWSGSAALGGTLIQQVGFRNTFLITAAVKLVAFLPLLPLCVLVDESEARRRDTVTSQCAEAPAVINGNGALHEPLLAAENGTAKVD